VKRFIALWTGTAAASCIVAILVTWPYSLLWLLIVALAFYICSRWPEACETIKFIKHWLGAILPHTEDPLLKELLELIIDALMVGTGEKGREALHEAKSKLEVIIAKYGEAE